MSKDINALVLPSSTFDGIEDVLNFIKEEFEQVKTLKPVNIESLNAVSELKGYLVEFPLYTSFPEFIAIRETKLAKAGCWIVCKTRHKKVEILTKRDGGTAGEVSIAYLVVTIFPYSKKALKSGNIQAVYDYAEEIANDYIGQYKLLPDRHNHDLSLLNNTNSGIMSLVHEIALKPELKSLNAEIMLLGNPIDNLTRNNLDLFPDEVELMYGSLNTMSDEYIWRNIQAPVYRLIEAYDSNCYGKADSAISLAASSIEGFLMATQIVIRVHQYGESEEAVANSVRNKSLSELLKYAQREFGLDIDKTTERNAYGKWHHRCYVKRNEYIHKQANFKPGDSRLAIASAANLISHITNLIAKKHKKYSKIAFYTKLITQPLK